MDGVVAAVGSGDAPAADHQYRYLRPAGNFVGAKIEIAGSGRAYYHLRFLFASTLRGGEAEKKLCKLIDERESNYSWQQQFSYLYPDLQYPRVCVAESHGGGDHARAARGTVATADHAVTSEGLGAIILWLVSKRAGFFLIMSRVLVVF